MTISIHGDYPVLAKVTYENVDLQKNFSLQFSLGIRNPVELNGAAVSLLLVDQTFHIHLLFLLYK